jgi:DNA polymerase, archaea type
LFRIKRINRKRNWFALTFEGIHKWIAFVHSKQTDILPVPNRYFGVYGDGTIKVRGIET